MKYANFDSQSIAVSRALNPISRSLWHIVSEIIRRYSIVILLFNIFSLNLHLIDISKI